MNRAGENRNLSRMNELNLRKLDIARVIRIDEMPDSLGDYGEVHLVIQHGQLRYINRVESHKAWQDDAVRGKPE